MKYNTALPYFPKEDIENILYEFRKLLAGEGLLSMGKYVQEFEQNFADYKLDEILNAIEKACFDEKYRHWVSDLENPYGDGTSARKIREALESVDLQDSKWYVKKKLCP